MSDRSTRIASGRAAGHGGPAVWARLMAVLLACLVLAACGRTALYSDLDEQQANELMAALLGAGIGADKGQAASKTGWEVRVAQDDFPRAMQVLAARRLPRERSVSMCETFKKEGFASSAIEEKARYQCSLQSEIAQTLSDIPGVAEARVHIALPERDPLGNETQDSSASVTIFEEPGQSVRDRETDIKVMVKDSIEGLDNVDKVTVKFYTLGAPQAATRTATAGLSMAAISPLAIGIGAGVLVLLAIIAAVVGRVRTRAAVQKPAAADGRIWNG